MAVFLATIYGSIYPSRHARSTITPCGVRDQVVHSGGMSDGPTITPDFGSARRMWRHELLYLQQLQPWHALQAAVPLLALYDRQTRSPAQ